MAVVRVMLPLLAAALVFAPLQTRADCLSDYQAGLSAAQSSGNYNAYQGLAATYTSCLGSGGGGGGGGGAAAGAAASSGGGGDCLGTYLAGIRAAQASGDYTMYQSLAATYTGCLGGGAATADATSQVGGACLSTYLANLATLQASGDYTKYAPYAKQYTDCLSATGTSAQAFAAATANVSKTAGTGTCLDKYLASIRDAEAKNDYTHYEQLASTYTACLGGSGASAQASAAASAGGGTVQGNCAAANAAALANAQKAGDATAAANLGPAYQNCLKGR